MDKADLAALLEAHGGRPQPVASLHVLRASSLSEDEQAFLFEHQAELATIDLSRWLELAAPGQRPAVIDALAGLAEREPVRFEMEVARAPRFQIEPGEVAALVQRLAGRVPDSLLVALAGPRSSAPEPAPTKRSAPPPAGPLPPDLETFDPGDLLQSLDFGPDSGSLGAALGLDDELGGPADSVPPPPMLGALLGELSNVNTARARTAWRAKARSLAADPAEDWSRMAPLLPREMADAVALRAASSPRADERATLLEWLLQNGARRSKLVELSVALVGLDPKVESVSQWLAQSFLPRVLADKAAWQKHGAEVLSALAARRAFGEMDQLFTAAVTGSGALGPGLLALPGGGDGALRGPAFAAFSSMLLARTASAVAAGQGKAAQASAAALASIGFPSRSAKAVASLRRKRAAKGDVARLLGVAPARGPKDPPQLEGFIAAVHVLSDAS